jgi:hypothetical protein
VRFIDTDDRDAAAFLFDHDFDWPIPLQSEMRFLFKNRAGNGNDRRGSDPINQKRAGTARKSPIERDGEQDRPSGPADSRQLDADAGVTRGGAPGMGGEATSARFSLAA